jgi:hypothetical protein
MSVSDGEHHGADEHGERGASASVLDGGRHQGILLLCEEMNLTARVARCVSEDKFMGRTVGDGSPATPEEIDDEK